MAACCTAAAYLVMRVLMLGNSFSLPQRTSTSNLLVDKSENTTTVLKIGGITCATCGDSISKGLEDIPGVLAVTVSMVTHEAITKHHNDVAAADLIAEIESLGYEAAIFDVTGRTNGHGNIEDAIEEGDRKRMASVRAWKTSFIGASTLTLATLIIDYLPEGVDTLTLFPTRLLARAIFSALVVLVFGFKIHFEAIHAIRHGRTDMSLLASFGIVLAFLKSLPLMDLVSTAPSRGHAPLFESTAILTSVIVGGRFLKAMVSRQSLASVSDLSIRLPECVTLITTDKHGLQKPSIVPLNEVRRGDHLVIYPGDMVPTDCVVVEGSGYVSQTHISGEILPVSKSASQNIFAGSTNQNGQLLVKVTRFGSMTWLQKTLRLIIEGNSRKSDIQEVTDLVASRFVATILVIAIATGIWHISGGSTLTESMDKLIAVLLCACPCAIGLASPTAVSIGIALASKRSILLYGGSLGIEAAAKVSTILFDKTGTLTTGKLTVGSAHIAGTWQSTPELRRLLWMLIEAAEATSKHPAAKAMVWKAQHELNVLKSQSLEDNESEYVLKLTKSTTFQGQGLQCDIVLQNKPQTAKRNVSIAIGTRSFVSSLAGSRVEEQLLQNLVGETENRNIESHVLINGRWAASLVLHDQIRPESRDVIHMLKRGGYKVGMITGGTSSSASFVAQEVGIHRDWIWSNMMPEDKVQKINDLRQEFGGIAMVGDNLNDIQAMAAADFSIGAFVDLDSITAVSVDALIVDDSVSLPAVYGLLKVVYMFELARNVYKTIRTNLAWTIGYNVVTVMLSAGMLERIGLTLNPINAGLAMSFSSVMVVVHAMRLERWKSVHLRDKLS